VTTYRFSGALNSMCVPCHHGIELPQRCLQISGVSGRGLCGGLTPQRVAWNVAGVFGAKDTGWGDVEWSHVAQDSDSGGLS
jgi:hypothetical protein